MESEDKELLYLIGRADSIIDMIKKIADQNVESETEDGDDGEGEVVALARRSLQLLGKGEKQGLVEG